MRGRTRFLSTLVAVAMVAAGLPLLAVGPDFLANLEPQAGSKAQGHAWFYLSEDRLRLRYEIKLNGLEIQGRDVPGKGKRDTVFGAQIRHGMPGDDGPVVLAFFGVPGQDDENMRVDPIVPTISGRWDNQDRNEDTGSHRMREMYAALCAGELYVNVQTVNHPAGALRGQIEPQPGACSN